MALPKTQQRRFAESMQVEYLETRYVRNVDLPCRSCTDGEVVSLVFAQNLQRTS